ncbi:LOW QUALITY PROTEIN: acrosomal protein KIAA1210 homolog [Lontra canadensis]|uniref:LOW QUALITY PROTEIN: acrosomal protein KIAA1210 homolog n=1 Tax=Lontra canadensis TaxID=76717 RepID=UPI0013F2C63F|nr:LOW QUALITY PROTEIN: acrosomal protein KIAA1210 homolog [Lontra canadensis]
MLHSEDSERPRAETLSGFVHRPAGVGRACGPLAAELFRRHARGTRPGVAQRFRRTMAGFYACLKNQDDPTMAESLSEVSGSLEVLEANDEVKKKSKFKAFKNFFGKKKKKEPEGARGGRRLKPSLSSGSINISSLKPVREGQRAETRAKSSMGSKALSHDSIFMLDPEPEISVHRICPSPERQRGRPRQRSQASRTLPRSGTSDVHGGVSGLMFGAVPRYVPRSGIWIGGSKVSELPSLRRRHSSSSPPLIRSHTTSADFEETSVDEESPKIPQRKDLPIKIMSMRKSSFEPSPGPTRSQCMSTYAMIASPSRTHLPMSSAARHKMALNPRKQKKRKNPQATGKAKQEEPILLVASGEEKSTTKPREADKWKPRRDGAGVSSLKRSKRTEMQDKKPVDKAAWAGVAWGESRESAAQGRLRSKQGSSASGSTECAPRGRRFKPSSGGLVPSERAGSPPTKKNARDCRLRNLSLERQVMEQPATQQAQRTPPQEPLPNGDGKRKKKAGVDLNTRKAPVSQFVPKAQAESVVWGPSPGREDGASGAEWPEARAPLSSGTESLSTTPEDVIFSVAMEAQVFMDPSHLQSEGEEAFSFDLQALKLKMESVQDIPAVCRERSPANILRAFTASISGPASARAEGGISAERLTPRSLSWVLRKPRAGDRSSDPESPSEEESGSKQQLPPQRSLQSSGKPHDDQDVFTGYESSAMELSSPERQRAARYLAGAFGNAEAEEASSDPESASEEEESGSEPQRAPSHPFQPLEEPDDDQEASDSESSSNSSSSDELLTPTSAAQALGEAEDQMSTESDGYMEKYDSAEEWSSADEDGPPGPPSQASAKPADQQQVASVSQILPAEWGVSVERLALSFLKPVLPQQMSKGSARPPAPSSSPVEPAQPRQPVQPRLSPQAEPQTSAGPDSAAAQWDIPPEPLPPRICSKRLGKPWVEQPVSESPEICTAVGLSSAELLPPLPPRPHSHPLLEPITEQAIQEPVRVPAVEGSICVELPPPRRPCQTVLRPVVEHQVCLGAESAGVDQNASVQPPPLPRHDSQSLTRPLVPQQAPDGPEMPAAPAEPWPPQGLAQASMNPIAEPSVFSGLEATASAAEKVISMEPLLPTYSAQALTNARGAQASEADGSGTEGASVELPPRDPSQPAVWPKVPPQPAPPEPVGASAAGCCQPSLGLAPGAALVPGRASPRTVYWSWLSSSFEQQDSEREESAALEWGISLEPRAPLPPLPPRKTSQNPRRRAVKRADSQRSASAPPERSTPPEQQSVLPEQQGGPPGQRSPPPERRSAPAEPKLPRCSVRSRGSTKVKQPVSEALEGAEALRRIAMEQHSLRRSSKTKAVVKQAAFLAPEGSMAQKSVSTEQPPPRMASQALTKAVVKQTAFLVPDGSLTQRRGSIDQLSSRIASQAPTKAVAKQPAFLAPEGSVAQRSISSDQLSPRMHSQALTKAVVKQPAFLVPDGSLTQRSVSTDQLSSRMASQALTKAVVRQQVSAAPEKFATERVASTEPWPSKKTSQSPGRYRVQQISYNFESVATQTTMYAKPVASKYPTQFSSRSKVQEMSSRIENTVAERSAKKPPVSRHPSQSFVKFMAEKVFSESAANSLSTNQLSKSLLRSKVQYPVFLGPENASTEGAISSKLLPLAHPLQPLGRPEGPREVIPCSESASTKPKQSSSKEQVPSRHLFMAPAKLKYQQVSSASQSSPEIQKSSEEPLPSRGPHQAKEEAELQPRLFLAGPASVPGDWNRSEEHQPHHCRYPCQVLTEPEYLPQVHPGSVSAAAAGATSESHPGIWSLSRGPASPNKTRKFRQVSEDLPKNTLLPDPKPMKLTMASTRQASTVGGTYSKGEGLKSSDRNNSHPDESTGEIGVETIFGVRLRKVPSLKKYKSEKQDDLLKFSSLALGLISSSTEQQIKRSFSPGLQGTAENPSTASDLAEKQQTRPQSESMAKKQPIYKVPGKALGQHSDCTASEPAWITMVKQKQKSSQVQIPKKETKTKNKAGAKPEAKEPRHGGELAATHRTLQKGAGLATENQSRKTFASDVNKLEKPAEKKLPKFTKAGFKDQKIAQMPAMAKETRRSSILPAAVQAPAEPEEPVWFSLAKEKAKAWTHISEIMQ